MNLSRPRPRVILSLTPLIDVVFILLVFFMLVSQFADWRKLELVPRASLAASTSADRPPLAFELMNDGSIRVGGKDVADLAAAVAAARRASPKGVIVRAGDTVAIQPVVDAVEALKAAGLEGVELARSTP